MKPCPYHPSKPVRKPKGLNDELKKLVYCRGLIVHAFPVREDEPEDAEEFRRILLAVFMTEPEPDEAGVTIKGDFAPVVMRAIWHMEERFRFKRGSVKIRTEVKE